MALFRALDGLVEEGLAVSDVFIRAEDAHAGPAKMRIEAATPRTWRVINFPFACNPEGMITCYI
jgi:hypothetical protein